MYFFNGEYGGPDEESKNGKRVEEDCMILIEDSLPLLDEGLTVQVIRKQVNKRYSVPLRTPRNWYNHFVSFGEYPYETRVRSKRL